MRGGRLEAEALCVYGTSIDKQAWSPEPQSKMARTAPQVEQQLATVDLLNELHPVSFEIGGGYGRSIKRPRTKPAATGGGSRLWDRRATESLIGGSVEHSSAARARPMSGMRDVGLVVEDPRPVPASSAAFTSGRSRLCRQVGGIGKLHWP
jgi:hypothetical protein